MTLVHLQHVKVLSEMTNTRFHYAPTPPPEAPTTAAVKVLSEMASTPLRCAPKPPSEVPTNAAVKVLPGMNSTPFHYLADTFIPTSFDDDGWNNITVDPFGATLAAAAAEQRVSVALTESSALGVLGATPLAVTPPCSVPAVEHVTPTRCQDSGTHTPSLLLAPCQGSLSRSSILAACWIPGVQSATFGPLDVRLSWARVGFSARDELATLLGSPFDGMVAIMAGIILFSVAVIIVRLAYHILMALSDALPNVPVSPMLARVQVVMTRYSARVVAQPANDLEPSYYHFLASSVIHLASTAMHYLMPTGSLTKWMATIGFAEVCKMLSVRQVCSCAPVSCWNIGMQLIILLMYDRAGSHQWKEQDAVYTYMLLLPTIWAMTTLCAALCEHNRVPKRRMAMLCVIPCVIGMVGSNVKQFNTLAQQNVTFPHPLVPANGSLEGQTMPSNSATEHGLRAAVCRAVDATLPATATSVLSCDHTLSDVMKTSYLANGQWSSFMVDSGAGERSLSPYHSDFAKFDPNTARSFVGISGAESISPASGTIHMVTLDDCMRPYIYSLHDVMYSPGCSARLLATIPEAANGSHFRSDLMTQTRSDGASLPFFASEGHWWTCGVIIPADKDPSLPPSSEVPQGLRHLDWKKARAIAERGGGYLDGRPASPAMIGPANVYFQARPSLACENLGSTQVHSDNSMPMIPPPPAPEFQYMCQDAETAEGCSSSECPYAHSERVMDAWIASRNATARRKGGSLQGNPCAAVTRQQLIDASAAAKNGGTLPPPRRGRSLAGAGALRHPRGSNLRGTDPVPRPGDDQQDTAGDASRRQTATKRKESREVPSTGPPNADRSSVLPQGIPNAHDEMDIDDPHGPAKRPRDKRDRARQGDAATKETESPPTLRPEVRSLRSTSAASNVGDVDNALPLDDGVGEDIDDEASYVGLIKTAHWFVGIGCAAHQLPSAFYPSCAFDVDSTAMEVFLGSFPDVPTSTTLKEAMKNDSAFLRAARESRVGFASPPCSQHTQANRRRDTYLGLHIMHPSATLVIDTIDALALVQHEVMVIECVPGMTTACHGQLPIRMNKAADDAGYTITQHSLDPLALGGCQTRARIFVVLVRKDVSRNRGPFTIPTVPKGVQSRNLISILDPVADVMPANVATTPTDANDEWTAFTHKHASDDPDTIRATHARVTPGGKKLFAFSTDYPGPTLTSKPLYVFDGRTTIQRVRQASIRELLRMQVIPEEVMDDLPCDRETARSLIGKGTEGNCMAFVGLAVAKYLNVSAPDDLRAHHRGRMGAAPARHLKLIKAQSFKKVSRQVANARLGWLPDVTMRSMGFLNASIYSNASIFNHVGAMARARRKNQTRTGRACTFGTFVMDFKGPFMPSKGGGYTSVLGFKHPPSGYVHEIYLADQLVPTVCDAFDAFYAEMKTMYSCIVTHLMFDRDPSFNEAFRTHLLKSRVRPDMSGAYDHWEMGSVESYWGAWRSQVVAMLIHGQKDETWWAFAANMANHVLNRTPRQSNKGWISPVEWFTNESPNLSHLRVPFSPTYVLQDGVGSLDRKALPGWFVGYPPFTRLGVWRHYMAETSRVQVSRHAVFNELHGFRGGLSDDEQAVRQQAFQDMVDGLERRDAAPTKKTHRPTIEISDAIAKGAYFVCVKDKIDAANGYIRDRCKLFHGVLLSATLGMTYTNGKGVEVKYKPSDAAYDLKRGWSATSLTPPPPYNTVPCRHAVASIFMRSPTMSDRAAADAVHPVHEMAHPVSTPVELYPDGLCRPPDHVINSRISKLDHDVFGTLTTDDRLVLMEHMRSAAYGSTTVAAELVYPGGSTKFTLRAGPPPNVTVCPTIPGPTSYKAAMMTPQWKSWLEAIHKEITGQVESGCWHWAELPPGKRALRNVLVLTQKLHADFTVERPKARICVDGSCEKPGEYADVSAFVAQLGTFKLLCAAMVELKGQIFSGDWTQAYLFAKNTAEQYMVPPPAVKRRYNAAGIRMVLRLVRALYGGKGSAGLWDACCDVWHTEYGFVRSLADPRLYVLRRGTARISMVLATDDTAVGVPSDSIFPGSMRLYRTYVTDLQTAFRKEDGKSGYTDKGLSVEFIGVGVDQTIPGEITLDMTATANNIVEKHGFQCSDPCYVPATPHVVMSENDCIAPGTPGAPDQTAYRSRVGSMLWLTRCALPIAAYQTGALARMNHAPGHSHWNASSTLLRWLATGADPRIRFRFTGKAAFLYVDSDFLPNYGTAFDNRRSTSGYCAFLAGACVAHASRRQKTVATSTAHAEYLAAFEAGREALRIRILLSDMGLPQAGATTLFEDNKSCLQMTESTCATVKMQHLDARFHWLREQVVKLGLLRLVYCPTADQVADCLTKPLPAPAIARFHGALSGFAPIGHPPLGVAFGEEEEIRLQGDLARSIQQPGEVDFIHTPEYVRSMARPSPYDK